MEAQNDIKRTLKQDSAIGVVRDLLGRAEHKTRASLARTVCQRFGFVDARSRAQIAGCIKALRELERAGHFELPVALKRGSSVKTARRLEAPVPDPIDVPPRAEEVRGLRLVKVATLELTTLVLTTDGVPLGVLGAQCSASLPKAADGQRGGPLPIEEKKTFAWIKGLRQCAELAAELPDTRQICVMDREADFYELFDEQRRHRGVDLLIRAKHDRPTSDTTHLFESVRQSSVKGRLRIPVPRQSTRAKKSKQKPRIGHDQRMAHVELRYREVEFRPASNLPGKTALTLRVVHVVESSPPADVAPLECFLLTTLTITTPAQAQECLRWYCLRWRIEDWHRVLKSGCRIEALQHKSAERLKRDIAINLVIAWRIMLMTLLGRECPNLPAEVLFSDPEIEVLQVYAKKNESTNPLDSVTPCAS